MRAIETFLMGYLLNALWQVPLLFGAALLMARLLRGERSAVVHRVWVAALLLEAALPALSTEAIPFRSVLRGLLWRQGTASDSMVTVVVGPASTVQPMTLPAALMLAVAAVYGLCLLALVVRLAWNYRRTVRFCEPRALLPVNVAVDDAWQWSSRRFRVPEAELAICPGVGTPLTIGFRRPRVLLPPGLLETLTAEELRTMFAHECAHVQRRDFGKNLLYEVLTLPIAWHPCLRLTRNRLVESREWVCDALAAEAVSAPVVYARSLLRLATRLLEARPTHAPHAIGMLDANALERRLMYLTQRSTPPGILRRSATLAACLTLGCATCASAWAFRTGVLLPAPMGAATDAEAAKVPSGVMAGQRLGGPNPEYPAEARAAKIQGTVVLYAVISKDGKMENLSVLSGPPELTKSAIDAVKQWSYKPYLLNGEPVSVETTINVTYNLNP